MPSFRIDAYDLGNAQPRYGLNKAHFDEPVVGPRPRSAFEGASHILPVGDSAEHEYSVRVQKLSVGIDLRLVLHALDESLEYSLGI